MSRKPISHSCDSCAAYRSAGGTYGGAAERVEPARRGGAAAAAGTAALLPALPAQAGREQQLVHHVLFWLKRPESKENRDQLIEGIRSLAAIETVRGLHVGVPADACSCLLSEVRASNRAVPSDEWLWSRGHDHVVMHNLTGG